eukprot:CAMPEP_0202906592 /NCGR_PEP_ID=MMETSP1392-20130828/39654_1 /ASSEMBLY_ACC=CAM_ASM_000868 /TAXON_ID=225041 /ORGANISM="Chlamydomonas chlamydogama, Strain SAG 11-48b" /LENGTH=179 /DNA_ID=CAMNT_0049595191 /DNA_START=193 /DNA_END=729 /DNA_ORIENTATION=+
MISRVRSLVAVCLTLLLLTSIEGVKLKFRYEECMTYDFEMYTPFYGSFVAMPDVYGYAAQYNLVVTSPSGTKVHETHAMSEGRFHLIPYETGRYKFCLTLNQDRQMSRYVMARDVIWDLHVGHADHTHDNVKEHDTQSLWHYVNQIDAQIQQLRSTQQYLYWRERRHRQTVDSTNRRVW